jgi:molecular chaperone DnaK (HSP70)
MESRLKKLSIIAFALFTLVACNRQESIIEKDSPVVRGDSLSEHLGIETIGGILTPILVKGCSIPCSETQIFSTAEDNQEQITIALVRGSKELASEGTYLGKYQISGIEPAPKGVPQIEVTFGASRDKLWLSAKDIDGVSTIKLSKLR